MSTESSLSSTTLVVGELAKNNLKINSELANSFRYAFSSQSEWNYDDLPFLEHFFVSVARSDSYITDHDLKLKNLKVDYSILDKPYEDLLICPFSKDEALAHIKDHLIPWLDRLNLNESPPIYYRSIFFDYPLRFIRCLYEDSLLRLGYCPQNSTNEPSALLLNNKINPGFLPLIKKSINAYKRILNNLVEDGLNFKKILPCLSRNKNKTNFYLLNFLESLRIESEYGFAEKFSNVDDLKSRKILHAIDFYNIDEISIVEFYRTKALSKCIESIPRKIFPGKFEYKCKKMKDHGILPASIRHDDDIKKMILQPPNIKSIKSSAGFNFIDMVVRFIESKPVSDKSSPLIIKMKDLSSSKNGTPSAANIKYLERLIISLNRDGNIDIEAYSYLIMKAATDLNDHQIRSFAKLIQPLTSSKYHDLIAIKCAMAILLEAKGNWLSKTIKEVMKLIFDDKSIFSYREDNVELDIFINIINNSILQGTIENMPLEINIGSLKWILSELKKTTKYHSYLINEIHHLHLTSENNVKEKILITQEDINEHRIEFVLMRIDKNCDAEYTIDLESDIIRDVFNHLDKSVDFNLFIKKFPLFKINVYHNGEFIKSAPKGILYSDVKNNPQSNRPNRFCKQIIKEFLEHTRESFFEQRKSHLKDEVKGDLIIPKLSLRAHIVHDKNETRKFIFDILNDSFKIKNDVNLFKDRNLILDFDLHSYSYFNIDQKFLSLTGVFFDFNSQIDKETGGNIDSPGTRKEMSGAKKKYIKVIDSKNIPTT